MINTDHGQISKEYPGEVFEALGYKSYLYSAQKKGYSGVALLTKQEPDPVAVLSLADKEYRDSPAPAIPAVL